ncbi:MAG: VOC family protein [Polyangiaceae bacterium]
MRTALLIALACATGCTMHAAVPAVTAASPHDEIAAVLRGHFACINEMDEHQRLAACAMVYRPDIQFVDPFGTTVGREAVARFFGDLHRKYPGARFNWDGAFQEHHGLVRMRWTLGRPEEAPLHTGEDIVELRRGLVASIHVFVDEPPARAASTFIGIEHVGVTVPSIPAAVTFFHEVLHCDAVTSMGAFKSDDDWLAVHLGVRARAEIVDIVSMRCGTGANLELFEYRDPSRVAKEPNNADIGGHHLAFYTANLPDAVRELQRHGVEVMGDPTTKNTGPTAGESFVYFHAPWGMQLELVSAPHGKAYEATPHAATLWTPLHPER